MGRPPGVRITFTNTAAHANMKSATCALRSSYFLMCARAVLLTNTMLDRLRVVPRFFISDPTDWIPSTSPLCPRAWTSLVMASCEGTRSSDSMALKFSKASVEGWQKV